jgi:hypothetical protein
MNNPFQPYRISVLILLSGTAMIILFWILLRPNPENPTKKTAQDKALSSVLKKA